MIEWSVAASILLFELLDAVALIGVDLPEQRDASFKDEMRDGDNVRGFGFRSADVESADNSSFFSHVENACHVTAIGNVEIRI